MRATTSLNRFVLKIVLIVAAGVVGGCSTPNRFRVDALARPDAAPLLGTYRIVGAEDDRGQTPPYFEEIAGQLRAALNVRGLVEVWGTARPDVEIVVDYGVGPPRQITRESMDMLYGMGTMETVYAPGAGGRVSPRSIYIPTQNIESRRMKTETYFESHLTIVGRQPESPRRDAEMREVWRVEVTTSDKDADVNELIPLMVTAAERYLATNSAGRQEVTVTRANVLAPEPGAPAGEQ